MRLHIPVTTESATPLPPKIAGYVSFRSQGGKSVFASAKAASGRDVKAFHAKAADRDAAKKALESAGFEIVAESAIGAAVVGPAGAYEEATGGKVITREVLMHAEHDRERYVTHIDIVGAKMPASIGFANAKSAAMKVEGLLVERPKMRHAVFPSPIPPAVAAYHLRVPGDLQVVIGAKRAHRKHHRGDGVKVAMVDTGQYDHPFFRAHHYDVLPAIAMVPGTRRDMDPIGHGTGESANIFAVAPHATLQPYRASDEKGNLVASVSAFLRAKAERPAVLTNSWGGDSEYPPGGPIDPGDAAWAVEIRDAIDQGIVVVFSAGNGHFSIEPQVPGVLAAGGAYLDENHRLRASTYASGYSSPYYTKRNVPDVCGLVGLLPRAQYLMLPVQPGCELDRSESLPEDGEPGDGTRINDGWAMFSGTSAAAPQLAGVAALILGAKPGLKPAQVIQAMVKTAIDVRAGRCHPRFDNLAKVGADVATGAGLVDASAAVEYALDNF